MTSPSGFERPVIPLGLADQARPHGVRARHAALELDAERSVQVGNIAIWFLAGSIGWATLLGVGWFAVEMVGRILA